MKVISLCLCLAVAALSSCFGVTGYTDRASFDAATTGYIQTQIVNFDLQADGSPAYSYGNLSIAATGLDSGGSSTINLQPAATSAFAGVSSPNAMGPRPAGHQFLAGNGDTITFALSEPVYAFGVYLVGNPSPTGDPAIPFWKMSATGPAFSFDAYSATEPLWTLGSGNDVYFLSVVSTTEPFDAVTLYSDNDLAAVFSFNVDDVVYASLPDEVSILQAKSMASGPVRITATVTRSHADRFNVQDDSFPCGIAVKGASVLRGRTISLVGTVGMTSEQEKIVNVTQILDQSSARTTPAPLAMGSLSVGGSTTVGLQVGIPGSFGPNNIGIDAAIWGRITAIDPEGGWMTVDDGAGRTLVQGITGVVVLGAINTLSRHVGDFVQLRGSVTIVDAEGTLLPAIRVAESGDIVP